MRDVEMRQRNIVFPDTAANEARFWANIISGKSRFSQTQVVGIAIIALALLLPLWFILKSLATPVISWLLLAFYGLLFLLLRWRVRKALSMAHSHVSQKRRNMGQRN